VAPTSGGGRTIEKMKDRLRREQRGNDNRTGVEMADEPSPSAPLGLACSPSQKQSESRGLDRSKKTKAQSRNDEPARVVAAVCRPVLIDALRRNSPAKAATKRVFSSMYF